MDNINRDPQTPFVNNSPNKGAVRGWQINLLIILISLLLIVLIAILYFLIFKNHNLSTSKNSKVHTTKAVKKTPVSKSSPVASIITDSNLIEVASKVFGTGCANTGQSPCSQSMRMLSSCADAGSYSTCPFTPSFESKLASLAPPNQQGALGNPGAVLTQDFQGGLLSAPTYSATVSNTGGTATVTIQNWGSYVLTIVLINGQLLVNKITFNGKPLGLCTAGIGC